MQIISEAKQRLTLVSPYNRYWGHLRREIMGAQQRGVEVTVYYRADEQSPLASPLIWHDSIKVVPVRMLHAKIYANESVALISSMNLLESSAMYSRDVGLLIRDAKLRREIDGYVQSLTESADADLPLNMGAAAGNGATVRKVEAATATDIARVIEVSGFCIECRTLISFDLNKPLCLPCYTEFGRTGTHKHCHKCSESHRTLLNEPLCRVCAAEQRTGV